MDLLPHEIESAVCVGQKVLRTEAQALERMAQEMPEDFEAVVDLILSTTGRVIVAGVGKSGHIGRKISATLVSTGTPSHFMHATEASHGDMGMITKNDICLVISNSGETSELRDIVAYTRRFGIPMVAISSRADSTLMRAADYRLTLPAAPEACLIGMVPTTSTTLTLALGDALGVALMSQRNFQAEDFRTFHPGGSLGAQMATVSQLMHTSDALPLVATDAPMGDVLLEMTSKSFGIAGVVNEDGKLIGVISDGDLRRNMTGLMESTAGMVANSSPVTIAPDLLAVQALALMNDRKIAAIFAVEKGIPVGVLHIHDCLRAGVS